MIKIIDPAAPYPSQGFNFPKYILKPNFTKSNNNAATAPPLAHGYRVGVPTKGGSRRDGVGYGKR